jgi:uncharacterized protein
MTQIKFNVAQLLRENIGARRDHTFEDEALPLDETLVLRDLGGSVRFVRSSTGVFARVHAQGVVRLVCVRSLEEFDYELELDVYDELHSVVDVMTGAPMHRPPEEDPFFLDELHMADIGEVLREYALLTLPLNPVAEAYRDQPVHYSVESEGAETTDDEDIDDRLAILKQWNKNQSQ